MAGLFGVMIVFNDKLREIWGKIREDELFGKNVFKM